MATSQKKFTIWMTIKIKYTQLSDNVHFAYFVKL